MQNRTLRIYFNALMLLMMLSGVAAILSGCGKKPANSPAATAAVKTKYSCPMHPTVMDEKQSDCPICGMRLELVDSSSEKGATDKKTGLATITISPEMRQLMGVTLGTVENRPLKKTIRTSAKIYADEAKLFRVTAKVGGWVEKLNVAVTGQAVTRGDPLLSIYSQELLTSEQEYLSALKTVREMPKDASDVVRESSQSVLNASKRRLQLWDISDEQIAQLEKKGEPDKTMMLTSPESGFVLEKTVIAGQKIMPGDSLMILADLSVVRADADIYGPDISMVRTGMTAEITVPSLPGRTFSGKISFISPTVDPETRTIKARLEIPNKDLLLKPEMFADAVITSDLGERLTVPENAIMRSGLHITAFVAGSEGKLFPLEIKTGLHVEGYYEVLDGLYEGDKVVTSANFLVDSESSRRAAIDAMNNNEAQTNSKASR